ncbi:MAG: phage GP46 family protein [Pseudomonadota bacterium]
MADRALFFDAAKLRADLMLKDGQVALDDGLATAVIISLFTDRRANADDRLPDDQRLAARPDRRGWWADPKMGSRLYLLHREKQRAVVLARAREYAAEALAWLIEDEVASSVDVAAEILGEGTLGLTIRIRRTDGTEAEYRFDYVWETRDAV